MGPVVSRGGVPCSAYPDEQEPEDHHTVYHRKGNATMRRIGINVLRAGAMGTWLLAAAILGMPPVSDAEIVREGAVTKIMTYVVAPGKEKAFEEARSAMFSFLKTQPGFVSVTGRQDLKDAKVRIDLSVWATRTQYNAADAALPETLRSAFMGAVSEWKYIGLTQ